MAKMIVKFCLTIAKNGNKLGNTLTHIKHGCRIRNMCIQPMSINDDCYKDGKVKTEKKCLATGV